MNAGQSVFGGEIVHKIPVLMQSKEEFDYEKYDTVKKSRRFIEQVALEKATGKLQENFF